MSQPRQKPTTARQLQRLVQAYVREYGLAEKRVPDWISYLAIGGALERAPGSAVPSKGSRSGA